MKRLCLIVLLGLGCSDAGLYDARRAPIEANRVALEGQVCTEDPELAKFPVRVVFIVDQARGSLFSEYDPAGERLTRLTEFIRSALQRPEYKFAVVGYGGRASKLAPEATPFGRNPGELINAMNRLSIPLPCSDEGYCRDYGEGLRVAGNIIDDDMALSNAGERGLTQYVVVLANGGPHLPGPEDCGGLSSGECQSQIDMDIVSDMRERTIEGGAAGFELHTLHYAAEEEGEVNDQVEIALERMAFVGGGRAKRYDAPTGIDMAALRLFDRRNKLRAKHFVVTNLQAVAGQGRMRADSDGDGLADEDENTVERGDDCKTAPDRADTDGDGVSDLVEVLGASNPCEPDIWDLCELLDLDSDLDKDSLSDCEEALLGTDASLVDTDGDGLPDGMEVVAGTDYLNRDGVSDDDGDGVINGDEVRDHTDPRNTDLPSRLGSAYRYTVEDLGLFREPVVVQPERITGVEIVGVGTGSTAGVGVLEYTPALQEDQPATLTWRDALDPEAGATVDLDQADGYVYTIASSSYAEVQADAGRFVRVRVVREQLSPQPTVERLRLLYRERHCLSYIVRNIRLMETLGDRNNLILYFAQAPEDRMEMPGPFRLALVPIRFVPPAIREPTGATLRVLDEEFVHYPRRDALSP